MVPSGLGYLDSFHAGTKTLDLLLPAVRSIFRRDYTSAQVHWWVAQTHIEISHFLGIHSIQWGGDFPFHKLDVENGLDVQ